MHSYPKFFSKRAVLLVFLLLIGTLGHVQAVTTWSLRDSISGGPASAQAQPYTFTKIADMSQYAVYCVGLSDTGTVIVTMQSSAPAAPRELRRGDGQPGSFTLVSSDIAGICASINSLDEIAYTFNMSTPSGIVSSLVRNSNGTLTTIATSNASPFLHPGRTYLPSLSTNGSVLFHAFGSCVFGGDSIYVGPSGPVVYDCLEFALQSGTAYAASMNDSLVATFTARATADGRFGVYRGSSTPLVADGAVPGLSVINNSGTVAFLGTVNGEFAIHTTADGIGFTRVSQIHPSIGGFSFNDFAEIAYAGVASDGQGAIFTGPNVVLDRVIGRGDPLDGSTVVNVTIWPEALNNTGQIAFFAELADGRRGVYRAEPPNRAPVAMDGGIPTLEDTAATGALSGTDADGHPLAYSIVTNGAKGSATINDPTPGAFTYVPNLNANGTDTFTFKANDGTVDSNTATITVTITPVNDAPAASDGTVAVTAGTSVSGSLVATDVDSGGLTHTIVTNGTKGTAVITNTATGAYTYTANAGSSGMDTFTFKANDAFLDSNEAAITVTITGPVCAADISASVSVSQGPLKLNKKTGRYAQTVTLRNDGGVVSAPVSLVLGGLSSNGVLVNATGTTACAAPVGSPYVNVDVGTDSAFGPRERATVTLEFTNPSGQPITYTARILAGVSR